MRVTDSENDRHSTAAGDPAAGAPARRDPLPRLRRRFFGSLVLIGLLVGAMIGRVTAPGPVQLLRVEPATDGLQLWFDREPELYSQDVDGAVGMLFQAQGRDGSGRLDPGGTNIGWRLQTTEKGLLLHFVATRPLAAEWDAEKRDGDWLLKVRVAPR
ncbi:MULTISPECIES: hypothetical protein [Pseudomonadaceae]|jgi:hypothetical protein|uniref:Uncharacterized protein n=1 Tax=Stutzerimonas stutzeri TaxID=316 RepID=A0A0D9AVX9_STUST|nr:hypothetical protein [Stutzerimonas stutzeri]KJH84902.1 hypothetical protein UF78_01390 [Stutzerimonas stutzeri]